MNRNTLINNFSKNAKTYEEFAPVQKICAGELIKLFPRSDGKTILEIGCGPGIFTEMLYDHNKGSDITAIDISEEMIRLAGQRMKGKPVNFLNASIEALDIENKFEIITSNAALHWVSELQPTVDVLSRRFMENGLIVLSIYGPDTFNELTNVLSGLYGKKKWLSSSSFKNKDEIYSIFKRNFTCIEIIEENFEMEYPDIWEFFYAVKRTGTRGEGISKNIFLTKNRIREIEKEYLDLYGRIKTTHNVYFCKGIRNG